MACFLKEACSRDRGVQFEGCVAGRAGRAGDKQRRALKLFIDWPPNTAKNAVSSQRRLITGGGSWESAGVTVTDSSIALRPWRLQAWTQRHKSGAPSSSLCFSSIYCHRLRRDLAVEFSLVLNGQSSCLGLLTARAALQFFCFHIFL